MPKAAQHTLKWSQQDGVYIFSSAQEGVVGFTVADEHGSVWLVQHTAFSFQGRQGQLNLLKERRARGGEGYWYAYQRQGKQMLKKYVGPDANLSPTHLERIVQEFATRLETSQETGGTSSQQVQQASKAEDEILLIETVQHPPLLVAKLQLPRLHVSLITRERLLARLDTTLECKLTLLCAPAGFGKTTLVRQWIAIQQQQAEPPAVAWVSLDREDNDPVRFWRYLFTASQNIYPAAGEAALTQLSRIAQPPFKSYALELVLTTFLNEIAHSTQEGLLVLEDYHLIQAPQVHDTLAFLLAHLPTTLHLVIMTRTEPELALARLRATNELNELTLTDLRFSADEVSAFLQQTISLQLSGDLLQKLDVQLEGWAVGLRFIALTAQGQGRQENVEQALRHLTGGRSAVQRYFVTEVLQAQTAEVQHFLLHTAILQRVTGSLCDALTRRNDGASILQKLEHDNLFVELLDEQGEWYRYHALFAEAMQQEARQKLGNEGLHHLFKQASQWYEQHHLYTEAVEAALQAQDFVRTVTLIEQGLQQQHFAVGFYNAHKMHEFHTMRRWLEQLPERLREQHPLLCQVYATALMLIYMGNRFPPQIVATIDRALTIAEQAWQRDGNMPKLAEIYAFRSLNEKHHGKRERAVELARCALEHLPPAEVEWRSISLGVVATGSAEAGQLQVAESTLREIQHLHKVMNNPTFRRANTGMLSSVYVEQGRYQLAAHNCLQLLAEARQVEDQDDVAHVLLGLAGISYEWNDLARAWQMTDEVAGIAEKMGEEAFLLQARLLQAQILQARGEEVEAQQLYIDLLNYIHAQPDPHLERWQYDIERWQALLHFRQRQELPLLRWLNAPQRQMGEHKTYLQHEREGRLVVGWSIRQGRLDEAEHALKGLHSRAERDGRFRDLLAVQVWQVHLLSTQKRPAEANTLLYTTLVQAQREGYIRLFLDEGEGLEALLRSLLPNIREPALLHYCQKIIQSFPQAEAADAQPITLSIALPEPLSQQELRVLRLLTMGNTNQEIARELVVSINTVRTQVQSIYRKLDVHNRAQAGEMARRLALV